MARRGWPEGKRRLSDQELMALLPESAPPRLAQWMIAEHAEEFGGNLTLCRRVSRKDRIIENSFIAWPGIDDDTEIKGGWEAQLVCTHCGEVWYANWRKGGGITAVVGEDGSYYFDIASDGGRGRGAVHIPGDCLDDYIAEDDYIDLVVHDEIADGDDLICPFCETRTSLALASKFRGGRQFRFMAAAAVRLQEKSDKQTAGMGGALTGVVWYLVYRTINEDGGSGGKAVPVFTAAVDWDGSLRMFRRCDYGFGGRILPGGKWKPMRKPTDPQQFRYSSAEAINATKVGCCVYPYMIDGQNIPLETEPGDSGEKTGLMAYMCLDGNFPFLYLRLWQRHPAAETLARADMSGLLDSCFFTDVDEALSYGGRCDHSGLAEAVFDWTERKPQRILGVSRDGLVVCREWGYETLEAWHALLAWGGLSLGDEEWASDFFKHWGVAAIRELTRLLTREDAKLDVKRMERYLMKQGENISMFLDYRRMLAEMLGTPGPEELWPPHLREAHDRLAASARVNKNIKGFEEILQRWGGIEYSDGEICAVLPRNNGELVEEGRVLHHCVGGYGERHVRGKIIVFIRHARRPERSWYTLNVDLTGDRPLEIQLHGYGNEYAHGKRLRIPARVREFCDRWEREVLTPVFQKVRRRGGEHRVVRENRPR